MPYGWLLRAISHFRTPKGPLLQDVSIDFIIDVHLTHGHIAPKGPECEGCALHTKPIRPITGPGVLDDIMASLRTVCDTLDRILWNIRDKRPLLWGFNLNVKIHICCCSQLDSGIWMPELRTWFPKSRKTMVLHHPHFWENRKLTPGPVLGLWCMHCDTPLWTREDKESS